jgi:antitoxin HicB
MDHEFTVILEPEPEGGFTVRVPMLPEVVTCGDTEDEALRMARDAIQLALANRRDQGEPIPTEAPPTIRRVSVAIPA